MLSMWNWLKNNLSYTDQQRASTFSRMSSNSEALASELLENLEEKFHLFYDKFSMFQSSTTQQCVTRRDPCI